MANALARAIVQPDALEGDRGSNRAAHLAFLADLGVESCDQIVDDMPVHICQAEIAPLVTIGQALMIDPQQMQDRGIQIVDVHRARRPFVLGGLRLQRFTVCISDVVAVVIGSTISDPRFDTPACHPNGETSGMMIAAIVFLAQFSLAINGAPELAAPNHKRLIQHALPL